MATSNSTTRQEFDEATDKLMLAMDLATVTRGHLTHTEEHQAADVIGEIHRKVSEAYGVIVGLEFKDRVSVDGAMHMIGKSRPTFSEFYGPVEQARVLVEENLEVIANLEIGEAPAERQLNALILKGRAALNFITVVAQLVERLEEWEIAKLNYERKS